MEASTYPAFLLGMHSVWGNFSVVVDRGLGATSAGSVSIAVAVGRDRDALVATTTTAAASGAAGSGVRATTTTAAAAAKAVHNIGRGLSIKNKDLYIFLNILFLVYLKVFFKFWTIK